MKRRETVGALALKAANDTTKYNDYEVRHEATHDIGAQLQECINIHNKIFDEKEYCVGFVYATDPLIAGVKRRKFFASLYLPSPRPEQTVFLYSKAKDCLEKRLWCLPDWKRMAILSELPSVDGDWKSVKEWCDAFYNRTFWHFIRKQHGIDMLSEHEYLNAHREELIQAGCKEIKSPVSDPFDFSKVSTYKVIDSNAA